ncbi:MAG: hypothetical protein AAFQ17_04580, partial [Pseudomonadota bacterium]
MREKLRVLKYGSDAAQMRRSPTLAVRAKPPGVAETNVTFVRSQEACNRIQKARLAAPTGAKQGGDPIERNG